MISDKYIERIRWDTELGDRLAKLRGDTSLEKLAEKIKDAGQDVSKQYINQLEKPDAHAKRLNSGYLTVSYEKVKAICIALGIEPTDLFDSTKTFSKKSSVTP